MGDDREKAREVWLSYKGENDEVINSWVTLLEETINYLKFRTNKGNIITIPYIRLIKLKERGENG